MRAELCADSAVLADYCFFFRIQMNCPYYAGFDTVSAAVADLFVENDSSPFPFGQRANRTGPHAWRINTGMADYLSISGFDSAAGLDVNSAVFQRYGIVPGPCAGHHAGITAYAAGRICNFQPFCHYVPTLDSLLRKIGSLGLYNVALKYSSNRAPDLLRIWKM